MKNIIDNYVEIITDRVFLYISLFKREKEFEHYTELKWKYQLVFDYNSELIEICRIDNYNHKNSTGVHIHKFDSDYVKFIDLEFKEAKNEVLRIGRIIIEREFKYYYD